MMHFDVIIIGAGPIGLFTAFQAGMLSMKCCIIDTLNSIGGQCNALYPEKPIYDIPGYKEISAKDLIYKLEEQANQFKPKYYLGEQVTSLTQHSDFFEITTSTNRRLTSKIVLIAAGAGAFSPNRPPLENIENYEGHSIFYHVDNPEKFSNKSIVIAGGGDSAIDWAIHLAPIANKIYLVHRRESFRAAPSSLNQINTLVNESKIEIVAPYQLKTLEGTDTQLNSVTVESLDGQVRILETDILLPFFGLKMSLGPILKWGLNIEAKHIEVDNAHYQTNIEGIYAVGDIASYEGKIKLILTGFAEASSALHHAYSKVFGKSLHFQYSTSKGIPNS